MREGKNRSAAAGIMSNSGYRGALGLPGPRRTGYILPLIETAGNRAAGRAMMQGRSRKWAWRVAAGLAVVVAGAGGWAACNWTELQVRYTAYRMQTASNDEDREKWGHKLADFGDPGLSVLVELIRTGPPAVRASAAATVNAHLNSLPEGDPRAVTLCGQVLDAYAACDEGGQGAVLSLLPTIVKRDGIAHVTQCRAVVEAGLKVSAVESRLTAIRAAMHPQVRMRVDVLPLLNAVEPEVRRAALVAVGPAVDDEPVIGDEELFHWLHDPDEGVRTVCRDALVSRGRSDAEISLGSRLTHPLAGERLKLLLDLRYDDELLDPEPWLERLSRDPDPGVRAGSARVAVELAVERHFPTPVWVGRLADSDPDRTVRRIAQFYRAQPTNRVDEGVRSVGGP